METVFITMYENASKIALNATRKKIIKLKMAYLMFALRYFDLSVFQEVV